LCRTDIEQDARSPPGNRRPKSVADKESERAMREIAPIEELRGEHDVVLAKMNEFAQAVTRLQTGEEASWAEIGEDVGAHAAELQEALLAHFRKEEDALFPDVLSMVSRGAPRADILSHFFQDEADDDLKAHTVLRGRLKDVRAVLEGAAQVGKVDGAAAAGLNTLVGLAKDLLERHAKKEHELVFPMIERLLDESQMAAVRERMQGISRGECAGAGH
jgi:hemerythrin-like domain-containing protein